MAGKRWAQDYDGQPEFIADWLQRFLNAIGKAAQKRFWRLLFEKWFQAFPFLQELVKDEYLGKHVLDDGYTLSPEEAKVYADQLERKQGQIKTVFRYERGKIVGDVGVTSSKRTGVSKAAQFFTKKRVRVHQRGEVYYILYPEEVDKLVDEEMKQQADSDGEDEVEPDSEDEDGTDSRMTVTKRLARELYAAAPVSRREAVEAYIAKEREDQNAAIDDDSGRLGLDRPANERQDYLQHASAFMISNAKTLWDAAGILTLQIAVAPDPVHEGQLWTRVIAFGKDGKDQPFNVAFKGFQDHYISPFYRWAVENVYTSEPVVVKTDSSDVAKPPTSDPGTAVDSAKAKSKSKQKQKSKSKATKKIVSDSDEDVPAKAPTAAARWFRIALAGMDKTAAVGKKHSSSPAMTPAPTAPSPAVMAPALAAPPPPVIAPPTAPPPAITPAPTAPSPALWDSVAKSKGKTTAPPAITNTDTSTLPARPPPIQTVLPIDPSLASSAAAATPAPHVPVPPAGISWASLKTNVPVVAKAKAQEAVASPGSDAEDEEVVVPEASNEKAKAKRGGKGGRRGGARGGRARGGGIGRGAKAVASSDVPMAAVSAEAPAAPADVTAGKTVEEGSPPDDATAALTAAKKRKPDDAVEEAPSKRVRKAALRADGSEVVRPSRPDPKPRKVAAGSSEGKTKGKAKGVAAKKKAGK
ncbi:hypothetical protein DFP72DRAFT_844212 [Ephemerocybe angulata]|uniref:Uncharacterized protein n=1 Tax=Ephemerocybe angulata TaxID=980116 RepID=A0A8H6I7V2_9AGAR|nr:hypothetical protein DFP72DRAFT_844212 [Tulosesus angulatus]